MTVYPKHSDILARPASKVIQNTHLTFQQYEAHKDLSVKFIKKPYQHKN